jgi:hypothetical protein
MNFMEAGKLIFSKIMSPAQKATDSALSRQLCGKISNYLPLKLCMTTMRGAMQMGE